MIFETLLSVRGVVTRLASAGLTAFLLGLGSFFGVAAVGLPLADFSLLGAAFFWLAPFLEGAFSGATAALYCATAAAFSLAVASAIVMFGNPFCARSEHDDSSLWLLENARRKRPPPR
jgi:hypothetical protein